MIRFLILALFACGCSSSGDKLRIGVDTKWYPLDFGPQTAYVNGYTEELLLTMAKYGGMDFEVIPANWDSLVDGLREKKYDAILSSMPPYEYNKAKFDFSPNYLNLGPVLIVPIDAKPTPISDMKGTMIGIITGDQTALILEKNPAIIIRQYSSIPQLLNGVVVGEIQGALLAQIPAVNYVNDLYAGKLKVGSGPLTDAGLHLVASKGNVKRFSKTLEDLRKRKVLDQLLKKWQLSA